MTFLDLYLSSFRKEDTLEWSCFSQSTEEIRVNLFAGDKNLFSYDKQFTDEATPAFVNHSSILYRSDEPLRLKISISKGVFLYQSVSEAPIITKLPGGVVSYNIGHIYNIFIDSGEGKAYRDFYMNIWSKR